MNAEVKRIWLEALRGGEYPQTRAALHDKNGYCCLGVLCDLHRKAGLGNWSDDGETYVVAWDDTESEVLPIGVQRWAGIENGNPGVDDTPLAVFNDGHAGSDEYDEPDVPALNFAQIADLIEEHL